MVYLPRFRMPHICIIFIIIIIMYFFYVVVVVVIFYLLFMLLFKYLSLYYRYKQSAFSIKWGFNCLITYITLYFCFVLEFLTTYCHFYHWICMNYFITIIINNNNIFLNLWYCFVVVFTVLLFWFYTFFHIFHQYILFWFIYVMWVKLCLATKQKKTYTYDNY